MEQPPRARRFRNDVVLTAANKVTVMVATLGSSIVIARELGPSGRGTWAVAMSLVLTLVQLGSLGMQSANPYFVARGAPIGRMIANSLWISVALGALLILAAIGLKAVAPGVVEGLGWKELVIASVGVPALLASMFLHSVMLGEQRMVAYNVSETGNAVALAVVYLAAAALLPLTVADALAIFVVMQVLLVVTYMVLLRRHDPPYRFPDTRLAAEMFRYGARVYIATLLAFLVIRIDVLLVNGYRGAAQAGYYSLGVGLADALYVLPVAVAVNVFPMISRGAPAETTAQIFRTLALFYAGVCLVAAALAKPAIELFYGSRFEPAVDLFYWLLPGIFALGMLTLLSYHFSGRGFPLEAMLVWVVGLAVNIAINLIFLPRSGTYVASLSSSVAYLLLLFLHMRLFAREVGGYRPLVPRPREFVAVARGALKRTAPEAAPGA
jgi:O-antigen/teichoic acid export membrane protein